MTKLHEICCIQIIVDEQYCKCCQYIELPCHLASMSCILHSVANYLSWTIDDLG